jgi:hypothetical protein
MAFGKVSGELIMNVAMLFIGPEEAAAKGAGLTREAIQAIKNSRFGREVLAQLELIPDLKRLVDARRAAEAAQAGLQEGKALVGEAKALATEAKGLADVAKTPVSTSAATEAPPASVTDIREAHRIRAKKAARAADVPQESELKLASGDRPRASSGGGKRTGGGTHSGGIEELDVPKSRPTESIGKGETNIPPEKPPLVGVEPRGAGWAIEDAHLGSMGQYTRPKAQNFPGIDGWKAPAIDRTRTLPNGRTIRTVSGADVVQVKGLSNSTPENIARKVKEGVTGLEPVRYEMGNVQVINPRSRTLDIVFDEGVVPEVTPQLRALMRDHAATAGKSGVEIRWFRRSAGSSIRISLD